ncbi:MAG: translation initiation factor IF-2 [Acidobacteria bacterium]|nr:translation initiation factor IF-2 [Acidobacteriota bacterium]
MRINELARELEVPSKQVIEALPKIGIADKKSHSSKVDPDEIEKIRKHFRAAAEAESKPASAPRLAGEGDEIKTKFDLSNISKPGDVLKAITQKQAVPAAPPRPATAPPAARPPASAAVPKPAAPAVSTAAPPTAPPPTAPAKPAPRFITPDILAPRPPAPIVRPEAKPPAAAPATPAIEEKAPAPAAAIPAAPAPSAPPAVTQPSAEPAVEVQAAAQPAVPARPAEPPIPPQPPARRMIVPQTGPRPVYQAPAQPRNLTPTPGQPIARRPIPGQPIAQRPRPAAGAPGMRPMPPGGRRPMHPTSRPMAPGARPGFGQRPMGAPPAGAPPPGTRRPGANRRPGQQYVPRGVKEGPMKGFVPPPRLTLSTEPLPITREITITEGISVKDLAEKLGIRAKDLIARLLARGVFATINQTLDQELAGDMARQFGADAKVITFEEQLMQDTGPAQSAEQAAETMQARPPVVTIMGHVDHGKTTLLDSIREANVAGGEAGGITQHIGAYKVRIADTNSPAYGREIAFIDTPGHEAFTRMRARGAKVTDIVVLVVAADDGVMPQTLEAMDHAKAANVPIIVAVNKIDKPDALPDRVKKQLADRGLMPEDWGGNTVFVDVSAKQKTNLNLLLEMICLVADLQEVKSNPDRPASGTVLEAKLDRGRGPVATVLIQSGTLKIGDAFVAGNIFGRVRAMFDDRGKALEQASPSTPVEILGAEGLPAAGDQFVVAERERAHEISEYRTMKAREAQLAKTSRVSLEGLSEQIKAAGIKELPIILKGDVQGSVEVLSDLLTKLSNEKVKIKVLHSGVGAITETDVLLASASNAIIIGFNVRPERKAHDLAEQEKVDIRLHSIIYELQDEIKRAMAGLLEPVIREAYHGRAEVRETFRIPKVGTIAGCFMQDGLIKRDDEVRLLRDNVVVFKGKVGSLRRFKDDVNEVRNGQECGIGISGYGDIKVGDVIEGFVTERIAQEVFA